MDLSALSLFIDQLAILHESIGHCIVSLSAYELALKTLQAMVG